MKHSLSEWIPEEPDFELFAIYSHLKDYRLSWILNRELSIELCRVDDFQEDKHNPKIPTYVQFLWSDEVNHREVYLLGNRPLIKNTVRESGMLFETEEVELLIPEKPKVDFFLKLYGQFDQDEFKSVETDLSTVLEIGLIERIDPSTLRSFVNLMH